MTGMVLIPPHLEVKSNVSLASHSSWLVGGPADFFAEPKTIQNLNELRQICRVNKIPLTVLGGGTNVLISDKGVRGMVVSMAYFTGIDIIDTKKNLEFWAFAGTNKSELLKLFLKHKLAPAKFLAGLPGQVGGGVVMNAGIGERLTPREFQEIVAEVEVLRPDGSLAQFRANKLQWDYRHCAGWQPGIITRVRFSWPMQPDEGVLAEVKRLNKERLQKQPLESPSCGSVFRNPLPETAGRLVEQAGLKGFTIGGAQVSMKHANFIINTGSAKASDIKSLMGHCVQTVKSKFGIELKSEVVLLGES